VSQRDLLRCLRHAINDRRNLGDDFNAAQPSDQSPSALVNHAGRQAV